MRARLLVMGLFVGALVLPGSAAYAAPPSNDTIGGATTIGSTPISEDTTEATTDAQDAALNATCGAPATDASVWFVYTAASDANLVLDVSDSDYSAGVTVATGSPGALDFINCGPGFIGLNAVSGTTYYITAFDDQFDGGGNGGELVLNIEPAPPAPEVTVTVNRTGHFNRQGIATVSGTQTCTSEFTEFADLNLGLEQKVGRIATIRGSGFVELICDGQPHAWSADVYPDSGKFAGGRAILFGDAFVCNVTDCTDVFIDNTTIQLRK